MRLIISLVPGDSIGVIYQLDAKQKQKRQTRDKEVLIVLIKVIFSRGESSDGVIYINGKADTR